MNHDGVSIRVGMFAYGLNRPLSGIGRYAVELSREIGRIQTGIDLFMVKPYADSPAGLEQEHRCLRIYGETLPAAMVTGPAQIAAVAARSRLDVVHDPFGISPFLFPRRLGRYTRVVTIHDMIPFIHPETQPRLTNILFQHYLPRTMASVDLVITVSEASKRDLIRFYGIQEDRVRVIYNGVSPAFAPSSQLEVHNTARRYGIPGRYVLSVGALQSRKNLETLFEAYRVLRQRGLDMNLVVAGKKAWKTDGMFNQLREFGLSDEVVFTGHVPDDDLPALYSGADMFVFPSLYEGFGLPPLEAMACGTPVITSNTSSLPEVVGNAGIMVDPGDVGGFAAAIERFAASCSLRSEYRSRGLERAAMFTWERCARQHVDVYRSLP